MRLGACADRSLFELDRFRQRLTSGGTIADFVNRRDLQKIGFVDIRFFRQPGVSGIDAHGLKILRGHSGKKAKILCRHQKYIFFAILDNSKNILEKRFFDQTSS
jgi:hypothetical protein